MQPEKRFVRKKLLQHGNEVGLVWLGEIDEMVQKFLLAVRKKDRVVNAAVARSVAIAW